ncbi:AraC family transcriptional regulator [Qingrenia yutianensis]|uniref:AraC family transcriptional regulator n=1 Tax=Qingrenia yutianensis TaxID=2763676 RepID=A0A926IRU5_9FIRM|nr:AraC family transcriptional regulator [Qingrenia yutianensis]MBC8595709.1 AraC family transcriptional regulator [Qingrenia yutianensis]
MNTLELEKKLNLKCLTENNAEKEVSGCYISDLLSLAMGRVGEKNVWITVQTNVNIVAIAVLTEASCVVVPENIEVGADVIKKAKDEDVIIFSADDTAYELAVKIGALE